jgi:hypothetical protein
MRENGDCHHFVYSPWRKTSSKHLSLKISSALSYSPTHHRPTRPPTVEKRELVMGSEGRIKEEASPSQTPLGKV